MENNYNLVDLNFLLLKEGINPMEYLEEMDLHIYHITFHKIHKGESLSISWEEYNHTYNLLNELWEIKEDLK